MDQFFFDEDGSLDDSKFEQESNLADQQKAFRLFQFTHNRMEEFLDALDYYPRCDIEFSEWEEGISISGQECIRNGTYPVYEPFHVIIPWAIFFGDWEKRNDWLNALKKSKQEQEDLKRRQAEAARKRRQDAEDRAQFARLKAKFGEE